MAEEHIMSLRKLQAGVAEAKEERSQVFTVSKERKNVKFYERDCSKCIHHISGSCSAWNCNGTVTLDEVKAEAYEQGLKDATADGLYKNGFSKGYAKGIDDFKQAFIEEGLKIKHLRHIWIENTCNMVAERLKGKKNDSM